MPIFNQLAPHLNQIHTQLQESVRESFPVSLRDPILYFLESTGKKIRPLLTILSCEAVGGKMANAMPAALGIELFHDFTLIHDDIMDRDELRRGRYTIHTKWGEDVAILVGDALVGLAYERFLQCDTRHLRQIMQLFTDTLIKVCEGQALDKEFEKREDVNLEQYLDMITKKTAWLIRLSTQVGAILGNGSQEQVGLMTHFGNQLGIAFQIQDDWLDYAGEENTLGKKVGSDLKLDKKTYISLKYQEILSQKPDLKNMYPGRLSGFNSLPDLKKALLDLEIAQQIEQLIDSYFNDALQALEKVLPLSNENQIYQVVLSLQKRQS
ncbi:MAG: polyprenyl synthetase family protein [bacterium]|nr:MAG: polyprenyl synthetase family protein [bacterium]